MEIYLLVQPHCFGCELLSKLKFLCYDLSKIDFLKMT